ncbi:Hypothetical predicted protein [Cloeon dipterum]|uniref:Uncharacterized protein n=1 Tax=Cloeon dipterum TaxID=197152 RepID=A0A8S1DX13_9INSE|nr:Hypothetical predicted protein [Cloeon dipterum]
MTFHTFSKYDSVKTNAQKRGRRIILNASPLMLINYFSHRFVLEAIPTPQHPSDPYMPAYPVASTLDIPISIHLDHLHSVYIAVGTLACALPIVSIT